MSDYGLDSKGLLNRRENISRDNVQNDPRHSQLRIYCVPELFSCGTHKMELLIPV